MESNKSMSFEEYHKKYFNEVPCYRCKGRNVIPSSIFPHINIVCPVCGGNGWVKDDPKSICSICDPINFPMCSRCQGS